MTRSAANLLAAGFLLGSAQLAEAQAPAPAAVVAPVPVTSAPLSPVTPASPTPVSPAASSPASSNPTSPGAAVAPGGTSPATPPAPSIPQPPGPAPDVWMPAGTAELRVMNKVDSHPQTLMLQVGQQAVYGSLTISLRSCLARPIDQIQDWAAYLDIADSHQDEPSFHGWMLANEPWIGMLEHPVYDVHLIACH